MDEEIRRRLNRIEESQSEGRTEIDEMAREITRLVRALDKDSESREKAHGKLLERIGEIDEQYDAIHAALRALPDDTVRAVEKIIYQLRIARHEALLAGVANEPPPLLPAPGRRDPTGSFAVPVGGDTGRLPRIEPEEETALTPAQQRGLARWFRRNLHWIIGGGGLASIGHRVYEALRHVIWH